jgi:hypothetical protein
MSYSKQQTASGVKIIKIEDASVMHDGNTVFPL